MQTTTRDATALDEIDIIKDLYEPVSYDMTI
jgi:hypothetical protein